MFTILYSMQGLLYNVQGLFYILKGLLNRFNKLQANIGVTVGLL